MPRLDVATVVFGCVLFVASLPVVLMLHEGGHVLGARLFGLTPTHVRIGAKGPVQVRFTLWGTEWRIHGWPWSDAETRAVARTPRPRIAWLALAASGPMGNAAIGAAAWMLTPNLAGRSFAAANLVVGYANCVGKGSDGAAFVQRLRPSWRPTRTVMPVAGRAGERSAAQAPDVTR